MNTPPKIKRHDYQKPPPEIPAGDVMPGLFHTHIGSEFAFVVSKFEHIEAAMSHVLAVLLGGHDEETAGYILRVIRNPSTKRETMKSLLEKAPINKSLPKDFDNVLSSYERVAKERNQLVHGMWWTHMDSKRVFVAKSRPHGFGMFEAMEVTSEDFEKLGSDMSDLLIAIMKATFPIKIARRRKRARLQPDPSPTQDQHDHPQTDEE